MENQNVRIAIAFVLGIVIGVGGLSVIMRAKTVSAPAFDEISEEIATSTFSGVTNPGSVAALNNTTNDMLTVSSQPAGKVVFVTNVTAAKPLWVAIHDDENGKPGKVLGAGLFSPGAESGAVELLRSTVAGTSYFAVVHTDDGDYHNYNGKVDVATDVMVKFDVK